MNKQFVAPTVRRCAIYTRKSTEAGLELAFNSLHAQREAGEAYIKSQAHEGWVLVQEDYDDGGISGGTMARPALQRLIDHIKAGHVDVVVVYKVDRLTRSLHDFAKMVELFDTHNVSFISVTQSFNTTSSMGRLTLNVLLSFAQFEREVTSERIRDKIAASKRKGLYMGGAPPLGYRVVDKKLVIDRQESQLVKHIFAEFVRLRSVRSLKQALDAQGHRTKTWVTSKGVTKGNRPFSIGHLRYILRSPIYRGQVIHNGEVFDGQHKAIIGKALFNLAKRIFEDHKGTKDRKRYSATQGFLLKGYLFDDIGHAMSPHTTYRDRGKKTFTYYVSQALLKGDKERAGTLARIGHQDLDQLFAFHLEDVLRNPQPFIRKAFDNRTSEVLRSQLQSMADQWSDGSIQDRRGILKTLGMHLVLSEASMVLKFETQSMLRLLGPVENNSMRPMTMDGRGYIEIRIPIKLSRTKTQTKIIPPKVLEQKRQANPALIKAVVQAHVWQGKLLSGEMGTIRELAKHYGYNERPVAKTLRLVTLAPDIVEAILDGSQPSHLTVQDLQACKPIAWADQRRALGFDA